MLNYPIKDEKMIIVNTYEDFPLKFTRHLIVNTENFGVIPDCDDMSIDVKYLTIVYGENSFESLNSFLSLFTVHLRSLTINASTSINLSLEKLTERFPLLNKIKIHTTKKSIFTVDTDMFGKSLLNEDETYNNACLILSGPFLINITYIIEIMYGKFIGCSFQNKFSIVAPRMKFIDCTFSDRNFAFLYIDNYNLRWRCKPHVVVFLRNNIEKLFIHYLTNMQLKIVSDCPDVRLSCCNIIKFINLYSGIGEFDLTMCDSDIIISDKRQLLPDYKFYPGSKILLNGTGDFDLSSIQGCYYKKLSS